MRFTCKVSRYIYALVNVRMIRIDTDFRLKNTDSPHEIVACLPKSANSTNQKQLAAYEMVNLLKFHAKFAMLPKAEMVPKEFGFNQSETPYTLCAGIAWCFPGLPATARDGELIKMQHSCHHVDIIRHPISSHVITTLYGTSTCGCNNNTIFWEIVHVSYCRRMPGTLAWQWRGLGDSCQSEKMAALLNSLFLCSRFSFCLSIVSNGAVGYNVICVYRWILPTF